MIHGSTSFNFCWSTNVEHCFDLLEHFVLVEYFKFCWSTTTHFGAKLKWRTRKCCCRFVLRALSPLLQGNSQLIKRRNHGDSRQHGKLSPELARIYSLVVPSFAAISTRSLSLMSRFLWSFDLTSYRHGKVSYRLISWLVLSKLQSKSATSNSSAAMLIFPGNHVTPNSKTKPFNKLQLVERNRAMLCFRSTTFNNFRHVERHISTFNIAWYTVQHLLNSSCNICYSTNVEPCIIRFSQQHPTCRNTWQHVGQTYTTCCAQQCCDMLRWHVATVCRGFRPGVNVESESRRKNLK